MKTQNRKTIYHQSVIYVKKQMKLSFTFSTNVKTEKKYGTPSNP